MTINRLWLFPLRVERGRFEKMPPDWRGAVVNFYAAAPTHQEALTKALMVVQRMGLIFVDLVDRSVSELDPGQWWDGYVMANFPEQHAAFPIQADIDEIVERGLVFHGPFVSLSDKHGGD